MVTKICTKEPKIKKLIVKKILFFQSLIEIEEAGEGTDAACQMISESKCVKDLASNMNCTTIWDKD
jgi:hypothetical protein